MKWYVGLKKSRIWSWQDLADAFFKQYKYNLDMALDQRQLQNMSQKDKEPFKEYVQR